MTDHDTETETEESTCPFCKETGYDLIGLKYHLLHHCDAYNDLDISADYPLAGLF